MFQIFLSHTSGRPPRSIHLQYCRRKVFCLPLLCSSPAAASFELLTQFLLQISLQMLRNNWFEREQSMTMFIGKEKDLKIFQK
jgi:hypothetical protein